MLPLLRLPSVGEEITIKILEAAIQDPRKRYRESGEYVIKCKCLKNDQEYYLQLRTFIFKEIKKECQNHNIIMDKDLRCIVGREFIIFGARRTDAPKKSWRIDSTTHKPEPPMIHKLKLIK